MACRRGVAGLLDWSLILTAALALLVPSAFAQDCKEIFDVTQGQLAGYDDKVEISFTVAETTPQGTELYELSWIDECVASPQINDVDFTNYFTIDDTEGCMWTLSVKVPLTGVPDYPDPKGEISILIDFKGFTSITYTTCHVTLIHTITEENTQTPEPESPNYTLDIKEDFNVGYAIPDFDISVHDKDGQSPNNQFSVSVDPGCPLEATQAVYTSGEFAQQVEFKLLEALDFETEQTMTCTVTFEDKGSPPLTDTASITIMVQDVNDEPPRFDYTYYYSELLPDVKPNDALVIQPSPISATDGDTSIGDPITYTMSNANPDVNGLEYFSMKQNSGEVTLLKELDNDFLLNERVLFFVQALEDSGGQAQVVLEVMLPWVNLVCGGFHFEQTIYYAEFPHLTTGEVVKVVAVSNATEDPTYSLNGEGSQYFTIDSNTGMISVNQDNPPPVGTYDMEAQAVIPGPSEPATTRVVIHVVPRASDEVTIQSSLIRASVPEGENQKDLGSVTLSEPAKIVCVTGAEPSDLKDLFTVVKQSDSVWTLKKSGTLDYETTKEVTLVLEAYTGDEAPTDCSAINEDIPDELRKSQALAIVTVTDTDDEAPEFGSNNVEAAYPTNEGLKRVVGPVVSVHATDKDTQAVTYSLSGLNANQFTVDEKTGEVYGMEDLTCNSECVFSVTASDGTHEDEIGVKVLPLDTGHVFTIMMPNTAVSEVDDKLKELSNQAGAQISMLYVSPTESTTRQGRTRYRRETTMTLKVHVYSIKDGALMDRDELNSALSDASSEFQAEEFIDAEVFAVVEEKDTTGLNVAVGVLSAALGIVIVAFIVFFVMQRKKGKACPKPDRPSTPISTLGQAYSNPSYAPDNSQVNLGSDSVGHKSNGSLNGYPGGGSLNGYTSAEVHRHQDQDSPPLYRSPLARPSDSIPLRTRDSPQQGGLVRTTPSKPEYYGSSSPDPPASFTSSSSPTYPIYAQVKKPKDTSTSVNTKKVDDTDDIDDLRSSKFSSLKHSPPPRRSNHDDDDDDDEDADVAYPGGKHEEESAEDEKKSVAFKVKVETKEIEAENMGPAQKKAEATMLMEANRKKIQEEGGDDDDDDEEQSMKL